MTESSLNERHCPLCGSPNACGAAAGQTTCWCFEVEVRSEVLEKMLMAAQGRVCVCRTCATGHAAPEAARPVVKPQR